MNYSCHQSRSQSISDGTAVTSLELEEARTGSWDTWGTTAEGDTTQVPHLLQVAATGGCWEIMTPAAPPTCQAFRLI